MTNQYAMEILNLSKSYKDVVAVDDVSINVSYGEIFALLGPNGSGKTTLIKTFCTLTQPDSGVARVCGYDVVKQQARVRQKITVVSQHHGMDIFLSGCDNLAFFAEIYGVPRRLRRERVLECMSMMGLTDAGRRSVMYYSGGMQRRLALAKSLLAPSTVLLLDEPTTGLDPEIKRSFWQYIMKIHKAKRATVLLATHDVNEAEDYCHALAILQGGKVVVQGTLPELKSMIKATDVIQTELTHVDDEAIDLLKALPGVTDVKLLPSSEVRTEGKEDARRLQIYAVDYHTVLPSITSSLLARKTHIYAITIRRPTLQDVYLQYLGKEAR